MLNWYPEPEAVLSSPLVLDPLCFTVPPWDKLQVSNSGQQISKNRWRRYIHLSQVPEAYTCVVSGRQVSANVEAGACKSAWDVAHIKMYGPDFRKNTVPLQCVFASISSFCSSCSSQPKQF